MENNWLLNNIVGILNIVATIGVAIFLRSIIIKQHNQTIKDVKSKDGNINQAGGNINN